ncbi:helix-turn-helix domain-containing protein [Glycomyces sp. NPDC046736]|uniref:helix-turn-helix domain-containing protein n=1 Tax=Glycomyces sp. NPDC046736 TaxID=3155615 RepID=UPI0033C58C24
MTQVRYRFRLYPTSAHRSALARGFGCCRVVFARRGSTQAQLPAGDCEEAAITTVARQVAASRRNLPRSRGREGQLRGSSDE